MSEINLPLKDLKIKSLTQANLYFPLFLLTDKTRLNYIKSAFAKSNASREKLSLLKANNSTPNRAFFVRAIYLSNKNSLISDKLFPMVERNGQPFAVGCFPLVAVSHPVTFYRPTVRSLAVVPEKLLKETTQMKQFIFAAIRRTDLSNHIQKIRINAETERDARAQFACTFILVLAGKINLKNTLKNDRTSAAHSPLFALPTQGGAHA
ncbi:host cell division inhibitor Icd-like protein [uncultured Aggregatibacter sp.]|uniref:host cell division inhibitor Icd-like protein n=1 Tax=uncultured Aggregatibacter sp. TaxID=470564 RepID=UPI001A61091E|nr:host cell division inhibitor Icd-like protein [uncultured Aggregatibacter sp.]VTX90842.1 Ash protein family protein [uncultured Aggregatibacter sp.]